MVSNDDQKACGGDLCFYRPCIMTVRFTTVYTIQHLKHSETCLPAAQHDSQHSLTGMYLFLMQPAPQTKFYAFDAVGIGVGRRFRGIVWRIAGRMLGHV